MKSRLLALWRRLPVPVRRGAHLTVAFVKQTPDRVRQAVDEAVQATGEAIQEAVDNTRQALEEAAQARAKRASEARTRRRAKRRNKRVRLPVTVVGFHGAVHGLGEGGRMLARGFADAGLPVRAVDLSEQVGFPIDIPAAFPPPARRERGVVISHINPPELMRWVKETEALLLGGRRHIGYWAWELEDAPDSWRPAFDLVDEVWTPSAFAADALRKIAPARVKVTPLPYPLYLNPRPAADRKRFGLPAEAVIVLMAFDLRSTAQRKNPYAALRAFQAAKAQAKRDAMLVCKVVGADLYPDTLRALSEYVAKDPTIRLMTESLSAEDMATLTASADVILSLHRSEGYGLLMAEAIWLGKPTLATGWSANVEFMDPASSLTVDYELIPVEGDGAIYQAGRWAAADEADAAQKLARFIDDESMRAGMAAATARNGHISFDRETWLRTIRTLLRLR